MPSDINLTFTVKIMPFYTLQDLNKTLELVNHDLDFISKIEPNTQSQQLYDIKTLILEEIKNNLLENKQNKNADRGK